MKNQIKFVQSLFVFSSLFVLGACFQMSGQPPLPGGLTGNNNQSSQAPGTVTPPSTLPQPGGVSLSSDFATIDSVIFQPKCVSCHQPPSPSGNYDMSTYNGIISGGRVVAFNPSTSSLYTSMAKGTMPPGGGLTQAEVAAVSAWITAGAPDNGTLPAPTPAPSPSPSPAPGQAATYSSIASTILTPKCLGCHGSGGRSPTLSTYADVLQIVKPFVATQSQLYTSVVSGGMPPGAPLTAAEKQSIADWINAGAQNN